MNVFNLPNTSVVNRGIPKNAFDDYANTRQKKLFTNLISRITWMYKLSPDTINLEAREIKEIQIFQIELKAREDISAILNIIDKAIPYNIVFVILFYGEAYISVSVKHPHPGNEDSAVIDWTFRSEWFPTSENKYALLLKKSIDSIFHDFCVQISGDANFANRSIMELVKYKRNVTAIEKEIDDIKSKMAKCNQFNEKVQLNLLLREKQAQLANIR